jgi:hypothetical protein
MYERIKTGKLEINEEGDRRGCPVRQQIVVAGGDLADDPIAKSVLEYGFQPVFYAKRSVNGIALTKGAIIKTNFCSHDLMWQVKNTYQSKQLPIFFCKGGFSHIKEEFERKYVDPVKREYANLKKNEFAIMMIGRLYERGETFQNMKFLEVLNKYVEFTPGYMSVFCQQMTEQGVLTKLSGEGSKGKYIWNGIDRKYAYKIAQHLGRERLPEEYIREEKTPKQEGLIQAAATTPVMVDPIQPVEKTIETVDTDKVPADATTAPEEMKPAIVKAANLTSIEQLEALMRHTYTKIENMEKALNILLKINEVNKIMERK